MGAAASICESCSLDDAECFGSMLPDDIRVMEVERASEISPQGRPWHATYWATGKQACYAVSWRPNIRLKLELLGAEQRNSLEQEEGSDTDPTAPASRDFWSICQAAVGAAIGMM
eukprot:5316788-Pleurochrysis_carterae.AAC.1